MTTPPLDPPEPEPDAAVDRHQAPGPLAVTPSDNMPRPEGLAFDVEPGADLTGVPVGDQTPSNPEAEHIEETVKETGESIGLAIPKNQPR
jgi:hypothetical protein